MNTTSATILSGLGAIAGGMIAIQSLLNATLGQRMGNFGIYASTKIDVTLTRILGIALVILGAFFFGK